VAPKHVSATENNMQGLHVPFKTCAVVVVRPPEEDP